MCPGALQSLKMIEVSLTNTLHLARNRQKEKNELWQFWPDNFNRIQLISGSVLVAEIQWLSV